MHSCQYTIECADIIFPDCPPPKSFAFAGPDEFKFDKTIDIFTAYKRYIASKPWVCNNYLRIPNRKPEWL